MKGEIEGGKGLIDEEFVVMVWYKDQFKMEIWRI